MNKKLVLCSVLVVVVGAVFFSSFDYINAASPSCRPWPSCKKNPTPTPTPSVTPTPTPDFDNQRVADINNIKNAIEAYYLDHGYYPTQINSSTLGSYLNPIPVDPATGANYPYAYNGSVIYPSQYQTWAELEKTSAALQSDSDINSLSWIGGLQVNGGNETCGTSSYVDCVYDLGNF